MSTSIPIPLIRSYHRIAQTNDCLNAVNDLFCDPTFDPSEWNYHGFRHAAECGYVNVVDMYILYIKCAVVPCHHRDKSSTSKCVLDPIQISTLFQCVLERACFAKRPEIAKRILRSNIDVSLTRPIRYACYSSDVIPINTHKKLLAVLLSDPSADPVDGIETAFLYCTPLASMLLQDPRFDENRAIEKLSGFSGFSPGMVENMYQELQSALEQHPHIFWKFATRRMRNAWYAKRTAQWDPIMNELVATVAYSRVSSWPTVATSSV